MKTSNFVYYSMFALTSLSCVFSVKFHFVVPELAVLCNGQNFIHISAVSSVPTVSWQPPAFCYGQDSFWPDGLNEKELHASETKNWELLACFIFSISAFHQVRTLLRARDNMCWLCLLPMLRLPPVHGRTVLETYVFYLICCYKLLFAM
jgi:hypothetical protein